MYFKTAVSPLSAGRVKVFSFSALHGEDPIEHMEENSTELGRESTKTGSCWVLNPLDLCTLSLQRAVIMELHLRFPPASVVNLDCLSSQLQEQSLPCDLTSAVNPRKLLVSCLFSFVLVVRMQ